MLEKSCKEVIMINDLSKLYEKTFHRLLYTYFNRLNLFLLSTLHIKTLEELKLQKAVVQRCQ